MPRTLCVDLSHHQAEVDFDQLKASGVLGVILKATEGTGWTDPDFMERYVAAQEAGLKVASYHFFRSTDVASQIRWYLETLEPVVGERVVIDHEDPSCSLVALREAVRFLFADPRNLQVTIYSGHLIKEQLGSQKDPLLARTALWLAQYTTGSISWPKGTWPTWSLWQWTDKGTVGGVKGNVDCNDFNGDPEAFLRWMGPAGEAPAELPFRMALNVTTPSDFEFKLNVNGRTVFDQQILIGTDEAVSD